MAYRRALDNLDRYSAGKPYPQAARTYDAQGQLLSVVTTATRTTLRRNAAGQVATTWGRPLALNGPYPTERTIYVYQPDGLVARQETADAQGQLTSILYYSYRYYPATQTPPVQPKNQGTI